MQLLTVDIGGTSIKFALCQNGQLSQQVQFPTPKDLESFYDLLNQQVKVFKEKFPIGGVGISSPGAVNKETGVIEGASALPYIHNFPIQKELEELFQLPISIENDANCAALAEYSLGAGKGASSMATIVMGTGVGGSLVFDGKIHHGAHLFGGEFGFMVMTNDYQILSSLGTVVSMAKRYSKTKNDGTDYTGIEVLEFAQAGDELAIAERQIFIQAIAMAIYNIQHAFDPEIILLGGGVSQADFLIPALEAELDKIYQAVKISNLRPKLGICHFKHEANLLGAYTDFISTYKD
ncbi:ROK family protein [Streptococcus parauberis]|uniref:ROK family protein n=1 Tax=Streptococcus parauberis TaxID=1348 RepID=UPI000E30AF3E|nr:ROK family protein [Streptococcus parauberis]RFE02653.1 Beta-glucoside kinase [Streptococcus parauberis]